MTDYKSTRSSVQCLPSARGAVKSIIFNALALLLLQSTGLSAATLTDGGAASAAGIAAASDAASARQVEAAFARGGALPQWARPLRAVPAKKRDDASVLRLAHTQFWAGPKPGVLVHRVVQANQSSALGTIGQFPINFVPHYQRATLHSLKVERGGEFSDRTQTVSIRFLNTEPGLDSGVYAGGGLANLLLEDVRVGDSVHITYSTEGANPVFRDQYSDTAGWDRSEGTDLRVVDLIAPEGRGVNWKMIGSVARKGVSPTTTTTGGVTVTTFEETDLTAIEDEAQIPSDYALHRFLQFSSYASWGEVSRWAQELFPVVATLPAELTTVLDDIRKLPTAEERAAASLRWVQSEVRYFSVSFGESSHRPYAPADVIARRYGDCKDKSYLLLTMLRALNIEARPLLVSLRLPRGASLLLPTPYAFDHVIVEATIGGRTYYLDGTRFAQPVPLAVLAPPMPNALALAADARATALIELPAASPGQASAELEERITIKSFDEPPTLFARNVITGLAAEFIRFGWSQMTAEQRRQIVNVGYEKRYPGAKAASEPEFTDDVAANRLTLTTRMTLPDSIRERQGDRAMPYSAENFNGFFALPQSPKRAAPALVASLPATARYQLTVEWPDNVSRTLDPVVARMDNAYFSGESDRQFRGNTYTLRATISTKVSSVNPDQLAPMRSEIAKFESSLGTVAYVPASSVQSRGFLGIGKLSLEQRLRRDYERRLEGAASAIKSGKLDGEDLALAHCERGVAYAFLDNAALASADADMAVKAAPSAGTIHMCRGNIRFELADFNTAIADYSRALSLGGTAGDAYYRRGHVRFYAGQYEAAAADFARAADEKFTADGAGAAHYAQLWQIWTLQRAGKPVPDKLLAQAKTEADGAWPRSAIAMLLGFKSPEAVLAEINAMKGEARDMNLSEAHFYLGQYWLGRGNKEEAKRAFEACRSQGVIMYIEHTAAGHELKRLN